MELYSWLLRLFTRVVHNAFFGQSPSFDFNNLLHMWLTPISTTARGQTSGDLGPLFWPGTGNAWETQASLPSSSSYQLDLSNTHAERKTQTSISPHPMGSAKPLIVLTLLKVCHIFLIIFARIHARAVPKGVGMWTCGERKCVRCIFLGKGRLASANLSN